MQKVQVYLSLGGNEGNVKDRLQEAIELLVLCPVIENMRISEFYKTSPVQVESTEWFTNAVCCFCTSLTLLEIFGLTQDIEKKLGKVDKPKNASRPIDIDILFYGSQVYQKSGLEVPHHAWQDRLFVLLPLADLTKEIVLEYPHGAIYYEVQECIQELISKTTQQCFLIGEKSLL